jgi:hypothetical protein
MTIEDIKTELREIIEISDKATPAPWIFRGGDLFGNICSEFRVVCGCPVLGDRRNNATFIATSRNLTPKMAKALLTTIDAIETALHYAHFVEKQDYEELAKSLETIRREWEVQA